MKTLRNYEIQQEIDMAEIDAIKDLEMVRMLSTLLSERLIDSPAPRINLIGADLAIMSQKARNLLNEIRYQKEEWLNI